MEKNFANRGQVVQMISGIVSPLVSLVALLGKNGMPSELWWGLLFVASICLVIALLNLYVGWFPVSSNESPLTRSSGANDGILEAKEASTPTNLSCKIEFTYLPSDPCSHGWTVGYADIVGPKAEFLPLRVNSQICLDMRVGEKLAIDHEIPRNAQLSKRIMFSVMYHKNTMLFLLFALKSKDSRTVSERWVRVELGTLLPRLNEPYSMEYLFYVEGSAQPDGWRFIDLSLREIIEKTWGEIGFSYEAVIKIRLRGSVSISPITFWS